MPRKKNCASERVGTGEQEENKNAQQLPSDESHRAISRRNGRLLRTEADTTSKKPNLAVPESRKIQIRRSEAENRCDHSDP